MKIIVASKNPVKIESTREAFSHYFPELEIEGITAPSNVPDQPLNDDTHIGAENRALHLMQNHHADYYVGIEGGIINSLSKWFCSATVCIIDNQGNKSFGTTNNFELPKLVMDEIHKGKELGHVMDEIMNETNTKQKGGAISYFTRGKIDRTNYYIPAIINALIPHLNRELYF